MFLDTLQLTSARRKTREGFLVAPAIFGNVEILDYTYPEASIKSFDNEMPEALKVDGRKIRIFRPEETLFSTDTINSLSNKPVTVEHQSGFVDSSNYKSVTVGISSNKISRDNDSLIGEIIVMDAVAIAEIESGKSFISLGYSPVIEWTAGEHPKFGAYDGIQRAIVGNHITLTSRPRSKGARILDTNTREKTMKRKLFGIEIEIPDSATEVFDSSVSTMGEGEKKTKADLDLANGKIAAMEKQIADLNTRIATVTDSAYLDNLAKERAAIVATAKELAPKLVTDSLSTDDVKRAVVADRLGAIDNASMDFVNGAFASLCKTPKTDEHKQIVDSLNKPVCLDTLDTLHNAFADRMNGKAIDREVK